MNIQGTNETALIAGLLQEPELFLQAREIVAPEDFIDDRCRVLFEAVERLEKFDLNILQAYLKKYGHESMMPFVRDVITMGSSLYVREYAENVKEDSKNRKIKNIANETLTSTDSVNDKIKVIESKLVSIYDQKKKGFRFANEMITDYLSRLEMLKKEKREISGLTTGLKSLDTITDGFKNGELIIIGARPSNGKTSLLVNIADHIAINLKKKVAVFSIESNENELMNKFVSQRAKISTMKLRLGKLTDDESWAVNVALDSYIGSGICINDLGTIDILELRHQIKVLTSKNQKPDIVMVDYLQRMQVEKGYDVHAIRLGHIVTGLKNIAKELDCPVVVLSQINRDNGQMPPKLDDLKGSGDIEQDADIIILLHIEEYYKKDKCPIEKKGVIDIDVAKNRNGPVCFLEFKWDGEHTRISEMFG